jgi:hypothetical protein
MFVAVQLLHLVVQPLGLQRLRERPVGLLSDGAAFLWGYLC